MDSHVERKINTLSNFGTFTGKMVGKFKFALREIYKEWNVSKARQSKSEGQVFHKAG